MSKIKLNIVKNNKEITMNGKTIKIPRLGYRHFMAMQETKKADLMLDYVIKEMHPEPLSSGEAEFLLIHLYYHNNVKEYEKFKQEFSLDDLELSDEKLIFDFDNIHLEFDKSTFTNNSLNQLVKKYSIDGKEIELTPEIRSSVFNELYLSEITEIFRGVIREVKLKGSSLTGVDIIGGE